MPAFCDVALPVPLDRTFTYAVGAGDSAPEVGCRVVVPFRNEKMIGVVTRLHDEPPPVEAKLIELAMDTTPVISPELMELALWIANYYLAPIGEVLRTMLPLMAEVRTQVLYRITDVGRKILFQSSQHGSSRRSPPAGGVAGRRVSRAECPGAWRAGSYRHPALVYLCHAQPARWNGAQEVDRPRNGSRAARR